MDSEAAKKLMSGINNGVIFEAPPGTHILNAAKMAVQNAMQQGNENGVYWLFNGAYEKVLSDSDPGVIAKNIMNQLKPFENPKESKVDTTNERGLSFYGKFKIVYGTEVDIQSSSHAAFDGTWIHFKHPKGVGVKGQEEFSIALTPNQIRMFIGFLNERLEDIEE